MPVVKVTGNQFTYEKMKENFDFYAGDIISDGVSVEKKGKELLEMLIRVANGELTTAEKIEGDELFVIARRKIVNYDCVRKNY